ncbi:hypothetical protein OQA88_10222 [Cercophora sp. LCS_1]
MPSRRSTYKYQPLASKTHIRLVQPVLAPGQEESDVGTDAPSIAFRLISCDLATAPRFTALSYTWGDYHVTGDPANLLPQPNTSPFSSATHKVLCDGTPFFVRLNLLFALSTLWKARAKGKTESYFWVDAICIDQDNLDERAQQVGLMTELYAKAEGVFAWLGHEDGLSKSAFKVLNTLWDLGVVCRSEEEWDVQRRRWEGVTEADLHEPWAYQDKLGKEYITARERAGWLGLVSRPYFRRAWIVQEIMQAKQITLCLGTRLIAWEWLERMVYFLEAVRGWGGGWIENQVAKDLMGERDSGSDCGEWDDGQEAYVNGVPVEVVYTRTARHLARSSGSLGVFAHREPNKHRVLKSLPSWVPDFSAMHEGGAMSLEAGGSRSWAACGDQVWNPDGRLLEDPELGVEGRRIGHVGDVCNPLADKEYGWNDLLLLSLFVVQPQQWSRVQGCLSRMDLLARTITRDTFRGASPAPAEALRDQFLVVLINEDIELVRSCFWAIIRMEPDDSNYSLTFVKRRHAIIEKYLTQDNGVYYGNRRRPVTEAKIVEEQMPELRTVDSDGQMKHSLKDRVVFCWSDASSGTFLGLGPADAREGDEIWALGGAKTPVVLRRAGRGRFEFLGEAYVHGMMHGEALERRPDVESIALV